MSEADEYGPGGDRESGPQSEAAIRDDSAAQTCGLWGCGKTATTPLTIIHPEAGAKEIVVCDYHSMMVRDAR